MTNKMKVLNSIICTSVLFLISMNHVNAQKDWANLNRYAQANKDLPEPLKGENRVVFMGNSITDAWPADFFENRPYFNRGISGQTTPQMLLRFRADVINLKPKVVVILAGINDIAGNTGPSTLEMITDNIESMCELATANNIKVILCSVLPANTFPWSPGIEPADIVLELNRRYKDYANKKGHIYLDYYTPMVDAEKGLKLVYAADAVHPNEEGYKVMGPLVEKAIKMALK
jgi:lysophospholipase L1-like esterase